MKNEILAHLNDPRQLEKLYRSNKSRFKREFNLLYPELAGNSLADAWNERLNYESDEITWGTKSDLLFVAVTCLVAGLIARLPYVLGIDDQSFYHRNMSFIVFPALAAYFAWKNKLSAAKIAVITVLTIAGAVFINAFPKAPKSDTLTLSSIHMALFMWCLLGFAFVGKVRNEDGKRVAYLKYNGELIVMTALIVISGGIMTGVTIGLFSLIGFKIAEFWFHNVVVFGLPAAPILGSYLTRTNPTLVGKVTPVIARIFSPLVLVMLIVYLVAMLYSGKNPYSNREFLIVFNVLLIGVMAIIFFSVAETSNSESVLQIWILFLLSLATIIVNGIALSAILFRISEWGFTPNRTAVLGGNILILINLLLVAVRLFKLIMKRGETTGVRRAIGVYLPVYFVWTIVVTFLFPWIFGFK